MRKLRSKFRCSYCNDIFDDDELYARHILLHERRKDKQKVGKMTTKEATRKIIKEIVTNVQGCKVTELITKLPPELLRHNIPDIVSQMMNSGELVEIEYVLPKLPIRIKSFLLPAGTVITFHTPTKYNTPS